MLSTSNNILNALNIFMERVTPALKEGDHDWYILGSCATLLQDCEIEPADIELTVKNIETARLMEEALKDYLDVPLDLSSRSQGVASGWYGQFMIEDVKVEIMAEAKVKGRTQWYNESYGEPRWNYKKFVQVDGHSVPVIPLEFILITNAYRGRKERVFKCAAVLKHVGYDVELLTTILKHKHVRNEQLVWIREALGLELLAN